MQDCFIFSTYFCISTFKICISLSYHRVCLFRISTNDYCMQRGREKNFDNKNENNTKKIYRRENTQKMRNKVKYEKLTTWDSFVCARVYVKQDQNEFDPIRSENV